MGRALVIVCFTACGFSKELPGDGTVQQSKDWAYKRKLTIDNTGITTELPSFTLGVHLDGTRIAYGKAKADGADVRVGDASGAFFPYEIEAWDPSGTSILWVRVPSIPANAESDIWLYYGNPNATDGQAAASVWDSDYVGVWHMADGHDSTGRNQSSNNGGVAMPGKLGSALRFAASAHVDTANTEHLTRWTVEVWMNPTNAGTTAFGAGAVVGKLPNYVVLWSCINSVFCKKVLYNGNASATHVAGYDVDVGQWQHIAGRYDGVSLRSYIAGVQSGSESTTDTPLSTPQSAKLGLHADGTGPFTGMIDEVRISRVARSLDFIRAHVRSTADAYLTYGPEEAN